MDRSLVLNPSFAFGWMLNGFLHLWAGFTELAIQHLETSLRLNPRDRRAFQLTGIGIAYFFNRRFEEAMEKLLVSLQELPSYTATHRFLAACYAHMGRFDDAGEIIKRLRIITPVLTPPLQHFRNAEHRELFLSGLRLATGEAI